MNENLAPEATFDFLFVLRLRCSGADPGTELRP
jgi:hypothetical protein